LTFLQWKKILDQLNQIDVRGINLTGGGEPLLNPCIREVVQYAKSLGFSLGLITNGILLNEYLDLLNDFKWIRVSVDTDNKEDYRNIRGVDSFDQVIENLNRAVELKRETFSRVTIGTHAVITKENINRLYDIASFYKKIGVDYFQFRPEEQTKYTKQQFSKIKIIIPRLEDLKTEAFQVINSAYKWEKQYSQKRIYTRCHVADLIGTIDAEGNWYICCHWVGFPNYSYGNLIDEPLEELLERRYLVQENIDINCCQIDCRGTFWNDAIEKIKNSVHIEHI